MNEEDNLMVAVFLTPGETELLALILGMGWAKYLDLLQIAGDERRDAEMIRVAAMNAKIMNAIGEAKK